MTPSREISRLLEIMAALRAPGTGCPWDIEQTFETIAPFTIEEAYEVADAIDRGDFDDLQDELGDLLLQVVFHARMAEEQGRFDFGGVVEAITTKLLRRHPHVFGDLRGLSAEQVHHVWDRIKSEEKAERARRRVSKPVEGASALSGVTANLPGLTRALKLQEKAGKVGFDWNDPKAVLAKIHEEADEIAETLDSGDPDRAREETGDLLFAVVNLARHLGVDPEGAIRGANRKFERRFAFIEKALAEKGQSPAESSLDEMDALWNAAKAAEKE